MSFKLFSISSMYSGSLELFYNSNAGLSALSYAEHNTLLIKETTEVVGSYIRNFRKHGVEADCVIANDTILLKKWAQERSIKSGKVNEILFDQVNLYSPDILWVENLSLVTADLLKNIRQQVKSVRLIIGLHCAPFNSKVLESIAGTDFIITCTPGIKSMFESMGKKSCLVYHGFDTDLLNKMKDENNVTNSDFIFSGSLITGGDFHTKRIRLIERILEDKIPIDLYVNLDKNYKIKIKQSIFIFTTMLKSLKIEKMFDGFQFLKYGSTRIDSYSDALLKSQKSPVYGIDMFELFQASKIVLNYHVGAAGNYAGNMRMFEVTGVGSCLLTDNKKNMSDLFDIEKEVVVYENAEDCISKIKWLLDHDAERKNIALAGQQRTLRSHTVGDRCRLMIEIINSELKSFNPTK